jgi:hypothetical protein
VKKLSAFDIARSKLFELGNLLDKTIGRHDCVGAQSCLTVAIGTPWSNSDVDYHQ